jgi:hypothetical protein
MKTTVEIPDSLLEQSRRVAAREHTTLRVPIEEGLRRVLADRQRAKPFKLRKASFGGNGLQPGMRGRPGSKFARRSTKGTDRDRYRYYTAGAALLLLTSCQLAHSGPSAPLSAARGSAASRGMDDGRFRGDEISAGAESRSRSENQ